MAAQGESEKAMLSGNPDILKRITRFRLESSRSEEHTSELQSLTNLVCRLLLEKKKKNGHRSSCHQNEIPRSTGAVHHSGCRQDGHPRCADQGAVDYLCT